MTDEESAMPENTGGQIVLRNHWSVIIGNILSAVITVGIMLFITALNFSEKGLDYGERWVVIGIILVGSLTFIFWRRWKLTTYTFGDTEITVDRDTVFKKQIHIQYSRLASVNVRRSIINHIFGTTALLFNVNSSVNSARAEAILTLKKDEADKIREAISQRIFQREMVVKEEVKQETLVEISNFDVILHGFFGQPSQQSIIGLASLAYSIWSLFWGASGGLAAIIIFVFSYAYPMVMSILRYYNYRIYRVNDTITVESGMINNYRSSFSVKKVNAIRIRQPLLARFMGKALLEAEVVGIADQQGIPLLCPLKSKKTVMTLANQLIPEMLFDVEKSGQPSKALIPTMANRVFFALVLIAVGFCFYTYTESLADLGYWEHLALLAIDALLMLILPAILVIHGLLAHAGRAFASSDELFMFVIGAYDRETDFIRYDKVQMSVVSSGIIQRRFGVAQCTISTMSAMGAKNIRSGVFFKEDLDAVPSEIMARIRDGRYDYKRYQ